MTEPIQTSVTRRWHFSPALIVLAAAPALVLLVGWLGYREAERRTRAVLIEQLNAEVETSVLALKFWAEDQLAVVRSWAGETGARNEILAAMNSVAVREGDQERILASEELGQLRKRLKPVCDAHGYVGFMVLDLHGQTIAALLDDAIGQALAPHAGDWISRARQGETVLVPPFRSRIELPDDDGTLAANRPTMLVVSPVRNEAGEIVGMLAFRLRPERQFAKALASGRPGSTGETYAFDSNGLLLSDSRFDANLRRLGLIGAAPDSHAALTLDVRDPGGDLTAGYPLLADRGKLPLTTMAASAVAGNDDVNVAGYRDYRGVPVVGAWRWLPEFRFGVAHEIDVSEAFAPLWAIRLGLCVWIGLTLAALVASIALHWGWLRAELKRTQAQQELAALAKRFQMVLDSATQVSIIATDMSGLVTVFNTGAERMLGYRADEMIGKQTPAVIHLESEVKEHGERLSQQFGRTIEGFGVFVEYARQGQSEEREWTYRRKDGSRLTVNLVVTALTDSSGTMNGFLGIAKDITANKRVEERFRLTVEASLTSLIMVDPRGRIVMVNSQTERTFGYSRAELVGSPIEMLVPPRIRERHPALVASFFANPRTRFMALGVSLQGVRKDGSTFHAEIGLNPIETNDGLMVLCAVCDVTERLAVELALREAKEAAESANRAKSNFLANVSHEIRTPMNAVIGMTELVLDSELTFVQRDYLTSVAESADGLLTIINEILDFSKIEAGQVVLEHIPFSLREMLGDALKTLATRAGAKGLELACRVPSDLPDGLKGDPTRLRQIVINLVGNAIKFTPQGEIVVAVEGQDEGDAMLMHFMVRDTGIGIPAEKLAGIFEPFTQADMTTTRRFGGTGLGLSICGNLMKLMDGRIWVESQLDVGSTFHFNVRLPRATDEEMSTAGRSVEALELDRISILVVDDNATNRLILQETLSNWGLAVQSVEGGAAALERLREEASRGCPFGLVVTDLHMPDMDGFQFIDAMRREPRLAKTPVIVLTSGYHRGDQARSEELGVASHLTKPVKQSELYRALAKVIGRKPSGIAETTARRNSSSPGRSPFPRLRILVAEDVLMNQKLALGLLTRWGHEAQVANNGREVLEKLDANSYDLILMDVSMPELDGLEATREIRRREQDSGRRLPIVAMTAHAFVSDREECLAAGMDGFVTKPIRRHELAAVLTQLFARRGDESVPLDASKKIEVDWELVLRGLDGDRSLLQSVLDACLEEVPGLNVRLEQAVAERNNVAFARAAHAIKGSLRILELDGPTQQLERFEQAGSNGEIETVLGELNHWRASWVEIRSSVEAYVRTLSGGEA